jgi:hypothetical protein
MEENDLVAKGYHVDDIAWLESKDKPLGMSASLGMWLNTPEAAEWIINNGISTMEMSVTGVETEVGFVMLFSVQLTSSSQNSSSVESPGRKLSDRS